MKECRSNDYWYTPPYVWDAVNTFFGLAGYGDPCPVNPEFNGLQHEWLPQCYINPPYSKGQLEAWIAKGVKEYTAGKWPTKRFLWLLNYGNTENHCVMNRYASAVCIPKTRIKFIPGHPSLAGHPDNPDPEMRKPSGPKYNNIFYLWGNPSGFQEAFKNIGRVYVEP